MNRSSRLTASSARLARWACLGALLVAVLGGPSVRCQFLQPQSHLGRLVQSITSPLVLSSSFAGNSANSDSYDSDAGNAEGGAADHTADQHSHRYQQSAAANLRRPQYQPQQQHHHRQEAGPDGGHYQQYRPQEGHRPVPASLQQAPSQQRGVPQHYRGESQYDEDTGAPTNHHKQQADGEQYQMGAYLGPTIDDKEIQGAFNSNDDKDDDEAAGYEGPPSSGAGRHRGSASSYAAASQSDAAGFAPQASGYGGPAPMSGGHSSAEGGPSLRGQRGEQAFDDELGADEDDEPSGPPARRQPRFKSSASLSQAAASQHQQRQPGFPRGSGPYGDQRQQSGMMAAANGYSPMGAGPFDLSGLMVAAGGAMNGAQGYEVYNGDGSYPGQGYYQQQGNGQQRRGGARSQAASMNSPYGYGGGDPYGPVGMQQQQRNGGRNADQDDAENDQDED